jgi:hypothetical protein
MRDRRKSNQSGIPTFRSEAEAAAFWDSHSPLDYPEDFESVQVSFGRPLIKRSFTVKLDDETIEKLTQIARAKGVGPSTLARMWILEHLRAESEAPASSPSHRR